VGGGELILPSTFLYGFWRCKGTDHSRKWGLDFAILDPWEVTFQPLMRVVKVSGCWMGIRS
jgi:hypothetical protein